MNIIINIIIIMGGGGGLVVVVRTVHTLVQCAVHQSICDFKKWAEQSRAEQLRESKRSE